MRKVINCCVLAALLWGLAAGRSSAQAPDFKTLFGDGLPHACSSTTQSFVMTNPILVPIYVKKAAISHDIDVAKSAVLASTIRRQSDNMLLLDFTDQRFAQPNGSTQLTTDFTPDYFTLAAGDALVVTYTCAAVSAPPFNVQVTATAWYTTVP